MLKEKPAYAIGQQGGGSMTLGTFTGRFIVVVVLLAVAAAIWKLTDILVLLFGAILLAIGICGAARLLARRTGIRRSIAMASVFLLGLCVFGAALWVFGSTIAAQFDDVMQAGPAGFKLVMAWLTNNPYGKKVLEQVRGADFSDATGLATSMVTTVVGQLTRGVGYAVVAVFVAIYLAAQPDRYRHLCFRLVPPSHQLTARTLFDEIGKVLERWLIGQIVVMLTIGVLTGIGLRLIGIEAALALGLMGGLLCFIPFVGAILAAVPATLVAMTQGPVFAVSVICMYVGVHFIEGNFITPMVQAEATSFPPVLAILSTVAFGILFGPLGVLLAAPLTLVLLAAVEVLYVQHGLGKAPEPDAP